MCASGLQAEFVQSILAAMMRRARYLADLTAAGLMVTGIVPTARKKKDTPVELPRGFLVELAAILEIRQWERNGILAHTSAGLPTFADAIAQLAERASKGEKIESSLPMQVTIFWLQNFAWEAQSELGGDVFLDQADDEVLLTEMAEFLFSHRHDLFVDVVETDGVKTRQEIFDTNSAKR